MATSADYYFSLQICGIMAKNKRIFARPRDSDFFFFLPQANISVLRPLSGCRPMLHIIPKVYNTVDGNTSAECFMPLKATTRTDYSVKTIGYG